MAQTRICFMVMPFRAELNFLFLFLQRYLQDRHGLRVQRGDTNILTKALMEKIETEIQAADLIIGDITYASPNVFYELGIARANRKPIIFMTQDDPKEAPIDLRHFEFIHYNLTRDQELLSKLDNAIQGALGGDYVALFDKAVALLQKFNSETESAYAPASLEEFQARVIRGERFEGIPQAADSRFAEFVLPKIVAEATDILVLRKMDKWLLPAAGGSLAHDRSAASLTRPHNFQSTVTARRRAPPAS
jgi:hypothetical protein